MLLKNNARVLVVVLYLKISKLLLGNASKPVARSGKMPLIHQKAVSLTVAVTSRINELEQLKLVLQTVGPQAFTIKMVEIKIVR